MAHMWGDLCPPENCDKLMLMMMVKCKNYEVHQYSEICLRSVYREVGRSRGTRNCLILDLGVNCVQCAAYCVGK